jgi:hypothetical protein
MASQVNWLKHWKKKYNFRSTDLKKAKLEELREYLEGIIKRRNSGKTSDKQYALSTLKWEPFKETNQSFLLVAYLTPSVIERLREGGKPGGTDSIITPRTPKQP